ncbi:MAG: class I SAM-dependent methyltransferase, partial [bacterium]
AMASAPPNWHFDYLAPIYDYLAFERNYDPILNGLSLSGDDRLLDLAGGTGEFLEELIERGVIRRENAYLIDLSESMLEQADERGLPNLYHDDTADMPFSNDMFQGVFAGDAIHHMGDPVAVFREVRRVLAPGGRFVIEEFDPSRFVGKLLYAMERLSGMGSQFKEPSELISLLETAGFSDVTHQQDGFVYYLAASEG